MTERMCIKALEIIIVAKMSRRRGCESLMWFTRKACHGCQPLQWLRPHSRPWPTTTARRVLLLGNSMEERAKMPVGIARSAAVC